MLNTIIPSKNKSFYRYFHPYFTKLPSNVVSEYIKFFSNRNDLILDPFCGSGIVGIEAILLDRFAICSDISPLAVFISKELINNKIDLTLLEYNFLLLKEKTNDEITKIWSFGTSDLYKKSNKYLDSLTFKYWFPENKLSYRSNINSVVELYDIRQLLTYAIIFDHISKILDVNIKNTLLIILFSTMARINLTYMCSKTRKGSLLHNGGSSIFSIYDYRKPKKLVVIPVWERIERKFLDVLKIKKNLIQYFQENNEYLEGSHVYQYDINKLDKVIEKESIDYIFTDPPYGNKIPYLELSSMWASWMKWNITRDEFEAEIIEGGELKKSQSDYSELMSKAIKNMSSFLKPNKFLSFIYQHNDIKMWDNLTDIFRDNGLELAKINIQPTNTSTVIKKKFKDVISVPLVINLKKTKRLTSKRKITFAQKIQKELNLLKDFNFENVYTLIVKCCYETNDFKRKDLIENIINTYLRNNKIKYEFYFIQKKVQ